MNLLCIAGFLHSGKTTVLLEVARAMTEDGSTLAVIENEIGERPRTTWPVPRSSSPPRTATS